MGWLGGSRNLQIIENSQSLKSKKIIKQWVNIIMLLSMLGLPNGYGSFIFLTGDSD